MELPNAVRAVLLVIVISDWVVCRGVRPHPRERDLGAQIIKHPENGRENPKEDSNADTQHTTNLTSPSLSAAGKECPYTDKQKEDSVYTD